MRGAKALHGEIVRQDDRYVHGMDAANQPSRYPFLLRLPDANAGDEFDVQGEPRR